MIEHVHKSLRGNFNDHTNVENLVTGAITSGSIIAAKKLLNYHANQPSPGSIIAMGFGEEQRVMLRYNIG